MAAPSFFCGKQTHGQPNRVNLARRRAPDYHDDALLKQYAPTENKRHWDQSVHSAGARNWLGMRAKVLVVIAAALFSSSCLISPPEPLEEQEQIPPRVLTKTAVPTTFAYYETLSSGEPPTFQIDFTSVDLGEELYAKLYLNFDDEDEELIGSEAISGETPDGRRIASVDWTTRRNKPAGCYTVTMTITYRNNYGQDVLNKPIDLDRTAWVTWFVAHDTPAHDIDLGSCPAPNPETP